MMLGGGW